MMFLSENHRGFPTLKFKDHYDHPCTLQMSSIWLEDDNGAVGGSAVWLGVDDVNPQVMARKVPGASPDAVGWVPVEMMFPAGIDPDDVLLTKRMHLNRDQVRELISQLQHWLDHAVFKPTESQ